MGSYALGKEKRSLLLIAAPIPLFADTSGRGGVTKLLPLSAAFTSTVAWSFIDFRAGQKPPGLFAPTAALPAMPEWLP